MADKALLIGINAYPGAPLAGCINDVTDMAEFLVKACNFAPASIRLLVDNRATTEAIKERLEWLVSGLKKGDRVVFQYSGHGAQVASRAGSGEVDSLDEVVCPYDFDWTDSKMIRDKDFNRIFGRIPPGVLAMWISDSCHSADLGRNPGNLGGRRIKALLPPADLRWRILTAHHDKMPLQTLRDPILPNIVLISGCKSEQTSADATFGKRPNGALTYFLLKELQKPKAWLKPMTQIITGVQEALRKANFEQVPQLEGPVLMCSKPFLGQ